MKRKWLIWILCFALILPLVSVTAYADCAPKPTTKIVIHEPKGRPVLVTLLAQAEGYGPYTAVGLAEPEGGLTEPEREAWYAFRDYEDPDGFHFWGYLEWNEIDWTYYPPEVFKVAVFYPDEDVLLVSDEVFESYAFHSDFRLSLPEADSSGAVSMELKNDFDWMEEAFGLFFRVALTMLVELALAWIFRYRSKGQIKIIFRVNLLTQVGLNVLLSLWYFYSGPLDAMLNLLVGEIVVLVVESVLYCRKLEGKRSRAVLYAIVANLASCGLGWVLI